MAKLIFRALFASLFSLCLFAGQEGGDGGILVNVNGNWVNLDEARNFSERSYFGIQEVINADCTSPCKEKTYGKDVAKWLEEMDKLIPDYSKKLLLVSANVEFRYVNNELAWEPDQLPDQVVDYKQYKKAAIYRSGDGNGGRVYVSIPVMEEMGSISDQRMSKSEGHGYLLLHELFNIHYSKTFSAQQISDIGNTLLTAYYSNGKWDSNRFLERLGKLGIDSFYAFAAPFKARVDYMGHLSNLGYSSVKYITPFNSELGAIEYKNLSAIYKSYPKLLQLMKGTAREAIDLETYIQTYSTTKEQSYGAILAIASAHYLFYYHDYRTSEIFNFQYQEFYNAISKIFETWSDEDLYRMTEDIRILTGTPKKYQHRGVDFRRHLNNIVHKAIIDRFKESYSEIFSQYSKKLFGEEFGVVGAIHYSFSRQFFRMLSNVDWSGHDGSTKKEKETYYFLTTRDSHLPAGHLVAINVTWITGGRLGVKFNKIELLNPEFKRIRTLDASDVFSPESNSANRNEIMVNNANVVHEVMGKSLLFVCSDKFLQRSDSLDFLSNGTFGGYIYPVYVLGNLQKGLVEISKEHKTVFSLY